jgi:hypothetical protein
MVRAAAKAWDAPYLADLCSRPPFELRVADFSPTHCFCDLGHNRQCPRIASAFSWRLASASQLPHPLTVRRCCQAS